MERGSAPVAYDHSSPSSGNLGQYIGFIQIDLNDSCTCSFFLWCRLNLPQILSWTTASIFQKLKFAQPFPIIKQVTSDVEIVGQTFIDLFNPTVDGRNPTYTS